MKTPFSFGLVLAPLCAALVALGALLLLPAFTAPSPHSAADGPACVPGKGADPSTCTELIELEVRDVIPLEEAQTHAVVLTTQDGAVVLPIFVDESAAVAIAFRLAHIHPPQPLAQDLLGAVVTELGANVVEVRIDDLRDDIYFGRVFLQQGKRRIALDARPSDSIAMAMDSEARILVTRKVLDEAGITREEIESLQGGGPGVGGSGEPHPGLPGAFTPTPPEEIRL